MVVISGIFHAECSGRKECRPERRSSSRREQFWLLYCRQVSGFGIWYQQQLEAKGAIWTVGWHVLFWAGWKPDVPLHSLSSAEVWMYMHISLTVRNFSSRYYKTLCVELCCMFRQVGYDLPDVLQVKSIQSSNQAMWTLKVRWSLIMKVSGRLCRCGLHWFELDVDFLFYRGTGRDDKELSLLEIKLKVAFFHPRRDTGKAWRDLAIDHVTAQGEQKEDLGIISIAMVRETVGMYYCSKWGGLFWKEGGLSTPLTADPCR